MNIVLKALASSANRISIEKIRINNKNKFVICSHSGYKVYLGRSYCNLFNINYKKFKNQLTASKIKYEIINEKFYFEDEYNATLAVRKITNKQNKLIPKKEEISRMYSVQEFFAEMMGSLGIPGSLMLHSERRVIANEPLNGYQMGTLVNIPRQRSRGLMITPEVSGRFINESRMSFSDIDSDFFYPPTRGGE